MSIFSYVDCLLYINRYVRFTIAMLTLIVEAFALACITLLLLTLYPIEYGFLTSTSETNLFINIWTLWAELLLGISYLFLHTKNRLLQSYREINIDIRPTLRFVKNPITFKILIIGHKWILILLEFWRPLLMTSIFVTLILIFCILCRGFCVSGISKMRVLLIVLSTFILIS